MTSDDPKMTEVVLDALDNILRAWTEICRAGGAEWNTLLSEQGGLEALLEPYVTHRDDRIRELVLQISERYARRWQTPAF
jgi:hypothetical protein